MYQNTKTIKHEKVLETRPVVRERRFATGQFTTIWVLPSLRPHSRNAAYGTSRICIACAICKRFHGICQAPFKGSVLRTVKAFGTFRIDCQSKGILAFHIAKFFKEGDTDNLKKSATWRIVYSEYDNII